MVCRKCNGVNDDDALFCKYCGTKLNEENICPSCNQKNDVDATFCKYCGTKLQQEASVEVEEENGEKKLEKKQKRLIFVKWIFSIVFFGIALLLMTLNFGSTFSNFIKIDVPATAANLVKGMNMESNLFSIIENIQNYEEAVDSPIKNFYVLGESGLFADMIQLFAILIAMIGSFAVLVIGASKAIYTVVTKKEYIDLKKYVALSVCFLICGALFVAIFGARVKMSAQGISVRVMSQLGGFVATSIWLSVGFLFLCMIYELVMNAIEKKENTSIVKSVFHIVEVALLVILVMVVAGTCLHTGEFVQSSTSSNIMHIYYKNGGWFSYLNETIYNMNKVDPELYKFSTISGVYIPSIISFILCMALIAVFAVFLAKRASVEESKYNGSLVVGIVSVCLSLAYMIVAIVVRSKFKSNEVLIPYLFDSSAKYRISIGASVITTFIFSILLLAEEIVGKVLIDKKKI